MLAFSFCFLSHALVRDARDVWDHALKVGLPGVRHANSGRFGCSDSRLAARAGSDMLVLDEPPTGSIAQCGKLPVALLSYVLSGRPRSELAGL